MTEFSSILSGKTTLADALPSPVQRQNSLKDCRVNRLLKSIRMGIAYFDGIDQPTKTDNRANTWSSVHDVFVWSEI